MKNENEYVFLAPSGFDQDNILNTTGFLNQPSLNLPPRHRPLIILVRRLRQLRGISSFFFFSPLKSVDIPFIITVLFVLSSQNGIVGSLIDFMCAHVLLTLTNACMQSQYDVLIVVTHVLVEALR